MFEAIGAALLLFKEDPRLAFWFMLVLLGLLVVFYWIIKPGEFLLRGWLNIFLEGRRERRRLSRDNAKSLEIVSDEPKPREQSEHKKGEIDTSNFLKTCAAMGIAFILTIAMAEIVRSLGNPVAMLMAVLLYIILGALYIFNFMVAMMAQMVFGTPGDRVSKEKILRVGILVVGITMVAEAILLAKDYKEYASINME